MGVPFHLPLRQRLTFRILLTTVVGLSLTLMAIAYTLLLSWQLEGGAAAINEAGSLRMRSFRLALVLEHANDNREIEKELTQFDMTLSDLRNGDAKRPLLLPATAEIKMQMAKVQRGWHDVMVPDAKAALLLTNPAMRQTVVTQYRADLPPFVDDINHLVSLVEVELAGKTNWLRLCQTMLIFMSLAASVAMLYLLYLWIIGPVNRMQAGIARMSENDLTVRLPIESADEFGALAAAFNTMADHVESAKKTLEQRVLDKTQKLQAQNREVSTLYELAAFLAGPHAIEELCRGFLHRIMQRVQAEGGIVRILDKQNSNMHITVHEGISEDLVEEEHCIKKDDCLCGGAISQGVVLVKDFRQLNQTKRYRCQEEGFFSIAIFQIVARQQVIGTFSLHFDKERSVTGEERRLLETLGQNLGIAIENQRLIAHEKEFAVSQERNLLAQGLHDSIAQGLNFLNLQVQMLEDSIKRNDSQEITDIVPMLRAGIEESYDDVRELLLNFRSRMQDNNLESEIHNVLKKFERQSGVCGTVEIHGSGAPLAPEQQLQVLFILQEALSNIRKHARATAVHVKIENQRDFELVVSDNGRGFSVEKTQANSEEHVGLRIMQERAQRLSAQLSIQSVQGQGTTISLHLHRQERLVA